MNNSSGIKSPNKINEIQETYNLAKKLTTKNIHALALDKYLLTISLLKQESKTDGMQFFQKMLGSCYQLYCYHANELEKYELTVKLIKDNYLEDKNLFCDWGFFYCEALLHLQMNNEFEITKSKLNSLLEVNDPSSIREILLTIEGEKYYLAKQYDKAVNCYEQVANRKIFTEGNRIFYYKYARTCYKLKNYQKTIELLDYVISYDKFYYNAYILKIKTFYKLKDKAGLVKLTTIVKPFFTYQNEYIHVYLFLLYIYALCHIEKNPLNDTMTQTYNHARQLLNYSKGIRNISITHLNKAYIYYFKLNAFLNGYNKEDLIVYPKNLYNVGKFAKIYGGSLLGENVIIKKYDCDILVKKKNPLQFNESLLMMFKELSALEIIKSKVKDFPIITVKCAFLVNKEQFVYIVTPLYKGGTLNQILHIKKQKISIKNKLFIISQIANAIGILHSLNIIHLNINSNNILFANDFKNNFDKIALTGFSKVNITKLDESFLGIYSAPELFNINPCISKAADIYSFGILMCEILNESIPFKDMSKEEMKKSKQEGYFPQFDEFEKDCTIQTYKNHLISLIMECLDVEIKNRISIEDIQNVLRTFKIN